VKPLIASLLATVLVVSGACRADDMAAKNPIDTSYAKAMEKDYSTAGMRDAANQARSMWDKDMNATYERLMALLDQRQQAALREAQRAWLKYRDAEGTALGSIVAVQDGTIWQLSATTQAMELVRQRALQLKAYEAALGDGGNATGPGQ
jgi:uncharacterized protein YecT (DUF1311 family)